MANGSVRAAFCLNYIFSEFLQQFMNPVRKNNSRTNVFIMHAAAIGDPKHHPYSRTGEQVITYLF